MNRREFLAGSSTVAISLGLPRQSNAWSHGSAVAQGFNNGRSQVQSWDMAFSGDFPFIDLMKTSVAWAYGDNSGSPKPNELDANGYPTVVRTNGYTTQVNFPANRTGSGVWVVTWDLGPGSSIRFGAATGGVLTPNPPFTNANLIQPGGGPGRFEFTTTETAAYFLSVDPASGQTNNFINYFYKDDETALNSGQVFGTQYLAVLAQAKPGVIRMGDWSHMNTTNATTWATRKPIGYYSYGAPELRASLYAGTSTSSGIKYAATLGSGAPVDKQTVHVNWNATPISISVANPGVCTWTAHGMNVGQSFIFQRQTNADVLPSAVNISIQFQSLNVYYVTNVIDANHFNFSATQGGTSVDTSAGPATSGSPTGAATAVPQTVTLSSGNPLIVTWTNPHGLNVGDPVSISSSNNTGLPPPFYNAQIFYVISIPTTSTAQVALTPGGTPIGLTSFAITGCNSNTNTPTLVIPGNNFASIGSITIAGVGGLSGINGTWPIQSVSGNNVVVLVSGSVTGTYTSGGTAIGATQGTISAFGMPSFNLNGAGLFPILASTGFPTFETGCPWGGGGNSLATLVFDAGIGGWLSFGGAFQGSAGLDNVVPPEIFLQLCAKIGAYPHFVAPFLGVDPMTDYVPQLANLTKTTYPWMQFRIEGPNELWNTSGGPDDTRYSWVKAPANWGPAFYQNQNEWYGKVISTVGQAVNAVYGGTPSTQTKYAILCGIETDSAGSSSNDPRLTCPAYRNQSAAAQTLSIPSLGLTINFTKDFAYNWATHSCLANYWFPGECGTPLEMIDAYNWQVTNNGNPTAKDAITTSFLATSNSSAVFTGAVDASGVLTVSGYPAASGPLGVNSFLRTTGINGNNLGSITALISGTGGNGTYQTNISGPIASTSMVTGGVINGSPCPSTFSLPYLKQLYLNCKTWAAQFGIMKITGYEGCYSPDYPTGNGGSEDFLFGSNVTLVSNATNAVVTVGQYNSSLAPSLGAGAVVGMPIVLQGVGGMTQINNPGLTGITVTAGSPGTVVYQSAHGLSAGQAVYFAPNSIFASILPSPIIFGKTYYVLASGLTSTSYQIATSPGGTAINITGAQVQGVNVQPCWVVSSVTTNALGTITSFALNVNSSAFSAYTSGGSVVYGGAQYNIIQLRRAGKLSAALQPLALQSMTDFAAIGGEFPSQYTIGGTTVVWTAWDPTIYLSPTPPEWAAIAQFNN